MKARELANKIMNPKYVGTSTIIMNTDLNRMSLVKVTYDSDDNGKYFIVLKVDESTDNPRYFIGLDTYDDRPSRRVLDSISYDIDRYEGTDGFGYIISLGFIEVLDIKTLDMGGDK